MVILHWGETLWGGYEVRKALISSQTHCHWNGYDFFSFLEKWIFYLCITLLYLRSGASLGGGEGEWLDREENIQLSVFWSKCNAFSTALLCTGLSRSDGVVKNNHGKKEAASSKKNVETSCKLKNESSK